MKTWLKRISTILLMSLLLCTAWQWLVPPGSEECSICRFIKSHAPCLLNLSTGEIGELALYEPHHTKVGKLAEVQHGGTFSFFYAAGAKDTVSLKIPVKKVDGVRLSLVQFFVCGVLSLITALIFETIDFNLIKEAIIAILYAGVLSSGVAYTLQIVSQKNLSPTVACLIMSLESVFAALSGAVFGERLTGNEIFGCVLVFMATILAQLPIENIKIKKPSSK